MSEVWVCLVTGANRGLGFEFVRQSVEAAKKQRTSVRMICCCRNPDTAQVLQQFINDNSSKRISFDLLKLEVTKESDRQNVIAFCDQNLQHTGLNMLMNNAGIMPHYCSEGLETLETSELHRTFENNFIGPTLLTKGLMKHLKRSAQLNPNKTKIVSISSKSGSMGYTRFMIGGAYDYRFSKVAINRTARNLAAEFGHEGIIALPICPGWAGTDMGNRGHLKAEFDVPESIEGVIMCIKNSSQQTNGLFVDHLGDYPPW